LRAVAADTVAIVEAGGYRAPGGAWVEIGDAVARAVAGTRLYLPDEPLPRHGERLSPSTEVTNESTLAAARRLSADGGDVAGLVFASARNPGGGFLTGALSQEEDVARASALHTCLVTAPDFYDHHRADRDLRYSDRVIYAPRVPVFRDEELRLLDEPFNVSMIVAAAPNLRAVLNNQPELADTVPAVVRTRAVRVLEVAAAHGHRRLVLGAWGCGVFGNDPTVVADAFTAALARIDFFDHVVFAVLDRQPATPTYTSFASRMQGPPTNAS
jgi:uncharacterized protein (TIGR02452 family)